MRLKKGQIEARLVREQKCQEKDEEHQELLKQLEYYDNMRHGDFLINEHRKQMESQEKSISKMEWIAA